MSEHVLIQRSGGDRHRGGDGGSVTVWMVLVVMVTGVVLALIGQSAGEAGDLARVQSTADLAALAGVDGGRAAAVRVAHGNGAELRSFVAADGVVTVEVADRDAVATATAERTATDDDPPDPDTPRGAS